MERFLRDHNLFCTNKLLLIAFWGSEIASPHREDNFIAMTVMGLEEKECTMSVLQINPYRLFI